MRKELLNKVLGDPSQKQLKKVRPLVDKINELEPQFEAKSNEELAHMTHHFRERLEKGETVDSLLPEAFAAVREAAKRTLGQRHYDVQLTGGIILHQGKIAEMRTGEGKTLTSTSPIYLNAISGKGVHVVTVNDYLARRDADWMGQVFHALGMSVSCIQGEQRSFLFDPKASEVELDPEADEKAFLVDMNNLRIVERAEAYAADITYGTNNEFGFDYLRDNMAPSTERRAQRGLHYAIVDEVDSILIDEARTPLIISSPAELAGDLYYRFASIAARLVENEDYNVDEKMKSTALSEAGIAKVEKTLGVDNLYETQGVEMVHHMEAALKAKTLFTKDKDYVVKDGEIVIVDEFTGRMMVGRRYSEGLHQAIEAKEQVEIKQESKTLATITFQNLFRMYDKLAGMTGTAETEAEEFYKIYGLDTVVIPTHKPLIRDDKTDAIFKTERGKLQAMVRAVREKHEKGQPVLIGTISIAKNEVVSQALREGGIPHNVLNAKNHETEAQIVAQAGKAGAVTVATNMAGRGVDIILGGAPYDPAKADEIRALGGLAVVGTERHESRRIDNQLRGRAGRQGDAGESQFYVSLDDDLMRIFGSDRMKTMMDKLGVAEDMPIENRLISRSIEAAQRKVEGHHFDIRKHLVQYDDIMNKHREVVYERRNRVLEAESEELRAITLESVEREIEFLVSLHTADEDEEAWDMKEIYESATAMMPVPEGERKVLRELRSTAGDELEDAHARTMIIQHLVSLAHKNYAELEGSVDNPDLMRQIERSLSLRAIDQLWVEHLTQMRHLREGIGLRGYGQRDPLVEYKKESYTLFAKLLENIQHQVVYAIFKVKLVQHMAPGVVHAGKQVLSGAAKTSDAAAKQRAQEITSQQGKKGAQAKAAVAVGGPVTASGATATTPTEPIQVDKIGRNEACPCGSGKKYKKCHGV